MDVSLYHESLDQMCKLISKPNAKILDAACGPGNLSKYILSKNPRYQVAGFDLAVDMVQLAQKNNPEGSYFVWDIKNISKLEDKYDAIVIGFCLPYLNMAEVKQLIQDCTYLLKADGILYVSTMEGEYENSKYVTSSDGTGKCFTHYYDTALMTKIMHPFFNQISITKQLYSEVDGIQNYDLILIASSNIKEEF